MKFSEIKGRTKALDIDVGGGDMVHVEYHMHFLTEEMATRINTIQSEDSPDSQLRRLTDLFCLLAASWDVSDDTGRTIPLKTEKLIAAGMTLDIMVHLLNAMVQSVLVGEAKSAS